MQNKTEAICIYILYFSDISYVAYRIGWLW